MQLLRERRGMPRTVLAGLLGMSPSWVKQVENGRLKTPKLPMILRIAEALRVRSLSELTGEQARGLELFAGPGHRRLPAVAAAVNAFPVGADTDAPPPEHLAARLARAWAARHQAPHHREVIGALLPCLLRDAQLAARQADSAAERRTAQAVLSETYSLTQFFVAYQPDPSLLWRVAERGMVAAQESEDPHALGVAAWLTAQAHRDSGPAHFDAADDITMATLEFLTPLLPDASDDVLAITGALQFEAGYTAARRGDVGCAWSWWDKARDKAARLPAAYYHPVTSFSRAIMGAHAVTVAVELHAGGESVRQAAATDATTIPSRPRRARHRIEEARGHHLDGQARDGAGNTGQGVRGRAGDDPLQRLRPEDRAGGSRGQEPGPAPPRLPTRCEDRRVGRLNSGVRRGTNCDPATLPAPLPSVSTRHRRAEGSHGCRTTGQPGHRTARPWRIPRGRARGAGEPGGAGAGGPGADSARWRPGPAGGAHRLRVGPRSRRPPAGHGRRTGRLRRRPPDLAPYAHSGGAAVTRMTLRISLDSGRTWGRRLLIRAGEDKPPQPLGRPLEYPPCACP
ncbi:hypothetical protein GCM10009863_63510 [Streptomyces axinellae]|uniref:HTH cro/C1-type domain-containing protein n=1 Tax=Streptomyces axinellae TaxID=552788 RepID=A0ABP6DCE2_9ACTN